MAEIRLRWVEQRRYEDEAGIKQETHAKNAGDDDAVLAMSHSVRLTAPVKSNFTFPRKVMTHFDAEHAT